MPQSQCQPETRGEHVVVQAERFDAVILGGGSGGYATALRAAQLGLRVALVEADKLGGTGLHRGCIPTTTLLHAADMAQIIREASRLGISAFFEGINMAAVHQHKAQVVARLHAGLLRLIAASGVTVVSGTGRLAAADAVDVDGRVLSGRAVVLATGSVPRHLPGVRPGGRILTSDQALNLAFVPDSAIVVGGGAIGVEFASLWRSLGASVTIIEQLDRLVPTEDEAVSAALRRAFRRRGLQAITSAGITAVDQDLDAVHVTASNGQRLDAGVLLVAVGRAPATARIGLARQHIACDEFGHVVVDERLRTTVAPVYAVGDVVAGPHLAYRAYAHGIFVAEEIAGLRPDPVTERDVPRVAYTDPQIAAVGLTEAQARAVYGPDRVVALEYNLGGNARTQILGGSGFVKVVQVAGGPIVGVHCVGPRVSELIGQAQLMVNWAATPHDVAALIHAHPTQNEALGEAVMALAGAPLHVHS